MTTRLTLVVHGPTRATITAAFPDDDPLDDRAAARLAGLRGPRADRWVHAPDPASAATCAALLTDEPSGGALSGEALSGEALSGEALSGEALSGGVLAGGTSSGGPPPGGRVDPGLRGWDLGRWAGRTLDDLVATEPDAVHAWTTDPDAAPHGGETLRALLDRVRDWMGGLPEGHTAAVCGPGVVRAAVVVAMGAPPSGFWRVDAGPLTGTDLRGGPARWTLRATGRPLTDRPGRTPTPPRCR